MVGQRSTIRIIMKHFYCPALLLFLLVGCTQTKTPSHVTTESNTPADVTVSDVAVSDVVVSVEPETTETEVTETVASETQTEAPPLVVPDPNTTTDIAISADPQPVETAVAEAGAAENWLPLFDGESTTGWSIPVYGGDGDVDVQEGNLVIGRGEMMTGIRYEKDFPKVNYEIRYEARRTQGYDFFAACTFPVKTSFCTFVNGGWGGGLTGLSSIDGYDASENETGEFYDYREGAWHRFRIRVMDDMIQVWLTAQDKERNWGEEKSIIKLETKDRELTTRLEMERYKPLGFCTWNTEGQLRKIEYRMIEP